MDATQSGNTDAQGWVRLPLGFANTPVIIEQVSDTEVRIRKAIINPRDEFSGEEEPTSPLSDRDRDRFLEMLDNPPMANTALKKAVRMLKRHGRLED